MMGKQSDRYADLTRAKVTAVFNKLGGMEGADRFLRGELELVEKVLKKHLINCDTQPFIPEGWKVVEHKKGGEVESDPGKIELYLCAEQKDGSVEGHRLREKLAGMLVMNANVLEYLVAHPELIPEEWKGKFIFFWGTIYCYSDGRLSVRFLYWGDGRWNWYFHWLDYLWGGIYPAALCK